MSGAVKIACLRLHALRWRGLSTSEHKQFPPPSTPEPLIPASGGRERGRLGLHPRMIFVRPWDGIPTMAHAFAIVCEIERQFGRIQEFVVVRDPEVYSSCCPFLHATFSKKEDADAIPLDGKVIQVMAPNVDSKRDGGIGLDDLHVYLNPETREQVLLDRDSPTEKEREWGPPEGEVIDVKLERTAFRSPPPVLDQALTFGRRGPPHLNNPIRTQELAHAIRAFGGFVDPSSYTQKGQTLMEDAVARWSRLVKLPPPQPRPVPAQENIVDEILTENPENLTQTSQQPVTPEEMEIPWTSFASPSVAPSPFPESAPFTPLTATPISSSLPATPSPIQSLAPSSWSKSSSETVKDEHRLKSQPEPKPEPNITKTEPKVSRKQRMLNAARLAGEIAVEKSPNTTHEPLGTRPQATSRVPDSGADHTNTELGRDLKGSDTENKFAARRWWKFLTGGN